MEQALELSTRAANLPDYTAHIQWILKTRLHQLDGVNQVGTSYPQTNLEVESLTFVLRANPWMQHLLCDFGRKDISMASG